MKIGKEVRRSKMVWLGILVFLLPVLEWMQTFLTEQPADFIWDYNTISKFLIGLIIVILRIQTVKPIKGL